MPDEVQGKDWGQVLHSNICRFSSFEEQAARVDGLEQGAIGFIDALSRVMHTLIDVQDPYLVFYVQRPHPVDGRCVLQAQRDPGLGTGARGSQKRN